MAQTVPPEKALQIIAQALEISPDIRPETREDMIRQAKTYLTKALKKKNPNLGQPQFGTAKSITASLISIGNPELLEMATPYLEKNPLNKHLEFHLEDHQHSPHLTEICVFWAKSTTDRDFENYALNLALDLAQKKKTAALQALAPFILKYQGPLDFHFWTYLAKGLQSVSSTFHPLLLPLFVHALSHPRSAHKACAQDISHNTCFASFLVLRTQPQNNPIQMVVQNSQYSKEIHGLRAPTTAYMIEASQNAHKILRLQQAKFDPTILLNARHGSFVKNLSRALGLPSHKEAKKQYKKQRQIENGRFT